VYKALCDSVLMYSQFNAKSSHTTVSLFSPSESVNLLIKWFGYLRFRYASAIFAQVDLEDLLIWSVNEYFSSFGNCFVILKILVARLNAFWYTFNSLKSIIFKICFFIISLPNPTTTAHCDCDCSLRLQLLTATVTAHCDCDCSLRLCLLTATVTAHCDCDCSLRLRLLTATAHCSLPSNLSRHSNLQRAIIFYLYFYSIYKLYPFLFGLDNFWRKLGF
jgi:hypothetical protein